MATELQELEHQANVLFWTCLAFYGAALWEMISRLPMEMVGLYIPEMQKIRHGKYSSISLPVVLVIINRLALPALVACSLSAQRQPHACQATFRAAYSLLGLTTATCKAIEVLRVSAIRRMNVVSRSTLWLAVACLFALWLTFANTQNVGQHPPSPSDPYGATCGPFSHIGRWHIAVWASDLLFEVVIVLLTLDHACGGFFTPSGPFGAHSIGVRRRFSMLSNVCREYYTGAFLWFVLSMSVNILQTVWFSTHALDLYGGLMVPLQIWLTTTMGPRLVVDLKATSGNFPVISFGSLQSHMLRSHGNAASPQLSGGTDRHASTPVRKTFDSTAKQAASHEEGGSIYSTNKSANMTQGDNQPDRTFELDKLA